MVVADWYNA